MNTKTPAKPIRVAFIGLNPDSHWAAFAHVPALKSLGDSFAIVGVANRTLESAQATAKAFGLAHAFASPAELVASSEVDLVVVTVKVPYHFDLVKAALESGKHVFCEWPLGNGLAEARGLAELAARKGVVAAVGTQMRHALETAYLKKLVADGYVGQVLSTTLVADGGEWGGETNADLAYLYDKSCGATMLSIPLGHTLAGLTEVLGGVSKLSARMLNLRDTVKVTDSGEVRPKTSDDQIMFHGVLESGAAISVHYRGGMSKGTNLLWEINGTEGDLQVTAANGHGQISQLFITGARKGDAARQPLTLPAEAYQGWPEFSGARNVAQLYRLVAEDIRTGSRQAPSFADGLKLHELLDRIETSAAANR